MYGSIKVFKKKQILSITYRRCKIICSLDYKNRGGGGGGIINFCVRERNLFNHESLIENFVTKKLFRFMQD